MLRIHTLNVGHGDSIILEYQKSDAPTAFALIDSNCTDKEQPLALKRLIELGATSLVFVAITHPHADHYRGMRRVIEHFTLSNIGSIYTFPVGSDFGVIIKLRDKIRTIIGKAGSEDLANGVVELFQILKLAEQHPDWQQVYADKIIEHPEFSGIELRALLPPSNVKTGFVDSIRNGTFSPSNELENDLSIGLRIDYAGLRVVLGGDGTFTKWRDLERRMKRREPTVARTSLNCVAVKLPHHGASRDCAPQVLDLLFRESVTPDKTAGIACISANGRSHPADSVIGDLQARRIDPYCTNLARRCGSEKRALISRPLHPELTRALNDFGVSRAAGEKCQGDITLEIAAAGTLTTRSQHNNYCWFRSSSISPGIVPIK